MAELFTSSEFKDFAKRLYRSDPLGTLPRFIVERTPHLESWLKRRAGGGPNIYVRPRTEQTDDECRITPRWAEVSADKARRLLHYQPTLAREEALQRTLDWAMFSRPNGGRS